MSDTIQCKKCGTRYEPETRLCVRCGTDLKTGELLKTETGVDETEVDASATRGGSAGSLVIALLPGLFQPVVLVVSLLVLALASVIGGYALWAVQEGEITGASAMMLLAIAINAQAMAWIVTGEFQVLIDSLSEMGGRMPYYILLVFLTLGLASYAVMLILPVEAT